MNKKKILALGLVVAVAAGVLAYGGNSSMFRGALNVQGTSGEYLVESSGFDELVEGQDDKIVLKRNEKFTGTRMIYIYANNRISKAKLDSDYALKMTMGGFESKINKWVTLKDSVDEIEINVSALTDNIAEEGEDVKFFVFDRELRRNIGAYNFVIKDPVSPTESTSSTATPGDDGSNNEGTSSTATSGDDDDNSDNTDGTSNSTSVNDEENTSGDTPRNNTSTSNEDRADATYESDAAASTAIDADYKFRLFRDNYDDTIMFANESSEVQASIKFESSYSDSIATLIVNDKDNENFPRYVDSSRPFELKAKDGSFKYKITLANLYKDELVDIAIEELSSDYDGMIVSLNRNATEDGEKSRKLNFVSLGDSAHLGATIYMRNVIDGKALLEFYDASFDDETIPLISTNRFLIKCDRNEGSSRPVTNDQAFMYTVNVLSLSEEDQSITFAMRKSR